MSIISRLNIPLSHVHRVIGESDYDSTEKIYIFTGKGPRGDDDYHLGNLLCHLVINKVSSILDCPIVFQVSTDEKRLPQVKITEARYKADLVKSKLQRLDWGGRLILFQNLNPLNYLPLKFHADQISKHVKVETLSKILGPINWFTGDYAMMQLAPLLHFGSHEFKEYRPLVITGGDQVGYFLLFRDICSRIGLKPPIIIELNPLKNILLTEKMSSSAPKYHVVFSKEGLNKIRQSHSDPLGEKDFCIHLMSLFKPYLQASLSEKVDSLITSYLNHKSSKQFKESVVEFFNQLLDNRYPLELKTLLSKDIDIFQQLVELQKNYVKSRD